MEFKHKNLLSAGGSRAVVRWVESSHEVLFRVSVRSVFVRLRLCRQVALLLARTEQTAQLNSLDFWTSCTTSNLTRRSRSALGRVHMRR